MERGLGGGRYVIVEELGRGGTGVVYRAHDSKLDRDVAIKVVRPKASLNLEDWRRRIHREAIAAARVEHPGISRLYDFDPVEGEHGFYLVMELVRGDSLRDLIKRGAVSPERALVIVEKLARALHFAHELGIVHRDMKPDNVIIEASGEPRILDLGIAKDLGDPEAYLTTTGCFVGTPAYASPEQASGQVNDLDSRTDVWSLGIVLYELLSGQVPWVADNSLKLFAKIRTADPPPLAFDRSSVAGHAARVAMSALVKRSQDRPDAHQLAEACVSARAPGRATVVTQAKTIPDTDIPPTNPDATVIVPSELRPPRASLLPKVLGVALALAVAGTAGIFALGRSRHPAVLPPPVVAVSDPGPALPEACRSLLATRSARLTRVYGTVAPRHRARVSAVAISPDGKQVLTAGHDHALKLWDLATETEVATVGTHTAPLVSVAFLPDGKRALTGTADGNVLVWTIGTSTPPVAFPKLHAATIMALAVSPDGALAVTGSDDKTLRLWDVQGRTPLATVLCDDFVRDVVLAPGPPGQLRLLAITRAGTASVYSVVPGLTLERAINGKLDPYQPAAVSPDGLVAGTLAIDGGVRLWELATGKDVGYVRLPHPTHCFTFLPTPGGRDRLLCADVQGGLSVVRLPSGDVETWLAHAAHSVTAMAVTPDRRSAVLATVSGALEVRRLDAAEVKLPPGHRGGVRFLAVLPDNTRLLSGAADATIKLWDFATGAELKTLHGHTDNILAGGLLPMAHAFSFGDTKVLRLWNLADGTPTPMPLADPLTRSCGVSADGAFAAVASATGAVRILDLTNPKKQAGHVATVGSRVTALAFARGGNLVVAADNRVSVWDPARIAGPAPLRQRVDFKRPVMTIATAAESDRALLACNDRRSYVWDFASEEVLCKMTDDTQPVSLALSPDGTRALIALGSGVVKVWDVLGQLELDRLDLAAFGEGTGKTTELPVAFSGDGRSFVVGTGEGLILRFDLTDPPGRTVPPATR